MTPLPWCSSRFHAVLLALVILAALAGRLEGLHGALPAHDSWRQMDTASISVNFLTTPDLLYPRVNWGAPGPGYVEAELQLFPYMVHLLYRALGVDPLLGPLLNLALAGLAALVLYRLLGRWFSPFLALAGVALFLEAPIVFRFSRAFMPEMLALLFYLLAAERFLAFSLDGDRWRDLLASAVAMALAILVKPTTIHLGLVFIIFTASRGGVRLLFTPRLLTFGAVSLLPTVLYFTHAAGLHARFGNTFGVLSGGDSKWGSLAYWTNPSFYAGLLYIDARWVMGGLLGVAVVALGLLSRADRRLQLLLVSWFGTIGLYYMIVARYAGQPERGSQYHVWMAVPAALALAAGLDWIMRWSNRQSWMTPALSPALAGGALALIITTGDMPVNRDLLTWRGDPLLRQAGHALAERAARDETALVLTDRRTVELGASNNFEQPDLLFHANRHGRMLPLDRLTEAGLDRALAFDPTWYVHFPEPAARADQGYRRVIERRMKLVIDRPRYQIYRVKERM